METREDPQGISIWNTLCPYLDPYEHTHCEKSEKFISTSECANQTLKIPRLR